MPESTPSYARKFLSNLAGVGEVGLMVGTGAITEVAGGLAGLASLPFGGTEGAGNVIDRIQNFAYQPRGSAAQRWLQSAAPHIKSVADYWRDQTIEFEQNTGVPSWITESLPIAALEIGGGALGLKGAGTVAKQATKLADAPILQKLEPTKLGVTPEGPKGPKGPGDKYDMYELAEMSNEKLMELKDLGKINDADLDLVAQVRIANMDPKARKEMFQRLKRSQLEREMKGLTVPGSGNPKNETYWRLRGKHPAAVGPKPQYKGEVKKLPQSKKLIDAKTEVRTWVQDKWNAAEQMGSVGNLDLNYNFADDLMASMGKGNELKPLNKIIKDAQNKKYELDRSYESTNNKILDMEAAVDLEMSNMISKGQTASSLDDYSAFAMHRKRFLEKNSVYKQLQKDKKRLTSEITNANNDILRRQQEIKDVVIDSVGEGLFQIRSISPNTSAEDFIARMVVR